MTGTDLSARSTSSTSPRHPGVVPALVGATVNAVSRVAPRAAGRLALELWRRPGRPADVRPEERVVHGAARRSLVEGAGTGVAAYAWGDAPRPVLLVHGGGLGRRASAGSSRPCSSRATVRSPTTPGGTGRRRARYARFSSTGG